MKTVTISIDGKIVTIKYPEYFNELTDEQYLAVVKNYLLEREPLQRSYERQLRLLFHLMTGLNVKSTLKLIDEIVKSDDIQCLLPLNNFLYEDQDFNRWIIRELKVGKNVFHGPVDFLSSTKFGEFISAEMLCNAYLDTKNEVLLNDFISVLFRPGKPGLPENFTYDKRIEFSSEMLESYAAEIAKNVTEEQKQAILFNYIGIRNWLTKKYPYVFPTSNNTRQEATQGEGSWLSIRKHLAGSVLNLGKVDELLMHDVLRDFNETLKNQ